jgi:predicted Fe-Mo cluster-binding NifX family protein
MSKYPYGTDIALMDGGLWDLTGSVSSPELIMKVAIMLYGTRVSPRFGYSQGVMIVEVSGHQEIPKKTLETVDYYPEQIPIVLGKEGVEVVIAGGMNNHFQNLFRSQGIQVIWGIIGEANDALAAFRDGQLTPGMGCCPEGRRPRQRQRRFRGRRYLP